MTLKEEEKVKVDMYKAVLLNLLTNNSSWRLNGEKVCNSEGFTKLAMTITDDAMSQLFTVNGKA